MANIVELAAQAEAECRSKKAKIAAAQNELDAFRNSLRDKAKADYDTRLTEIDDMIATIRAHVADSAETIDRLRVILTGDEK